jgi:serine/threonine-protein kinase ATR
MLQSISLVAGFLMIAFEDEVEIMNSMQKPRKITVKGSDGLRYPFLVKPKDDLRKDARLMEFNSIINKLLKKDVDSSRRQLCKFLSYSTNQAIRTYSVVPLNEEHGIVEWVPHTRVLRDIIMKYLRQKGLIYNVHSPRVQTNHKYPEIRLILDSPATNPTPAERFVKELLPKYPPVLWEWFVDEFAGPTAWLESRMKFSRTLAVMSFVGYVLGLGDRHSENILLDATTGAAVHVDFNCLFEKVVRGKCDLIVGTKFREARESSVSADAELS